MDNDRYTHDRPVDHQTRDHREEHFQKTSYEGMREVPLPGYVLPVPLPESQGSRVIGVGLPSGPAPSVNTTPIPASLKTAQERGVENVGSSGGNPPRKSHMKATEKSYVRFRIRPDMYDRLVQEAEDEGRSMSSQVERIVTNHFRVQDALRRNNIPK